MKLNLTKKNNQYSLQTKKKKLDIVDIVAWAIVIAAGGVVFYLEPIMAGTLGAAILVGWAVFHLACK